MPIRWAHQSPRSSSVAMTCGRTRSRCSWFSEAVAGARKPRVDMRRKRYTWLTTCTLKLGYVDLPNYPALRACVLSTLCSTRRYRQVL
eukprot:577017-Pleurochrysis_carterae.AAC.2